jgi:zinc and cadmium transporter
MSDYLIVTVFSLVGGLFSLIGGVILLGLKQDSQTLSRYAIPFAAGALLAAVFTDLLPEGLENGSEKQLFTAVLAGILTFFIAERFLRWFHHHHEDDEENKDFSVSRIIIGDTTHNALDGVAIASAFLVNIPTGIVTTLAVAAHEIPHEIADFGLLAAKGMARKKVLIVNALSSLATTLAAVLTFALGSTDKLPIGILLGLSAGFLLYIALSDLIPMVHAKTSAAKLIQIQTVLLILGAVVVGLAVELAHGYIDSGH